MRYTFLRDGIWQVRLSVQSEARPHMPPPFTGLTEIWRSLETGDEQLAEIRRGPIISELLTIRAAAIEAAKSAGHGYTLYPAPPSDATFRRGSDGLFEIEEQATDFGDGTEMSGRPPEDAVMIAPEKYVWRGGGMHIRRSPFEIAAVANAFRAQKGLAPVDPTSLTKMSAIATMKPADAKRVVPAEGVIVAYAARPSDKTRKGQKGINRKRAILAEVAKFAGYDDMNRITTRELDSYFADLVKRLSPASIRDYYIHLNALFGWAAKGKRHIDQNPMAEIEPQGAKSENHGMIFYDEQRAAILRAADAIDWRADPVDAPIKFANLIAGYMGRELAAIVEARTFDFSQLRDGMWVFDIRRDTDRPLKTDEREGKLALHPAIARAGFPDYLEWVRATHGEGPLFPMLTVGKDGRRNTNASNVIMRWLRSLLDPATGGPLITDPRQRFHSWRHTITTLLTDRVDGDRIRFITGHAGLDVHAKVYKQHPPHAVAKALALLADPLENP